MASSTRKQCGNEDNCKQTGVANCEGCSQVFCIKHFNDHRRSLDEEMNVILSEYNDFKNLIIQEPTNSKIQLTIQEINDWEQESVKKIQQKAAELRDELVQIKTTHIEYLSVRFQSLTEQIKKGKEEDDFIETDLRRWKKRLDDLKSNLTSPSIVILNQHDNIPLVYNMSVSFLLAENNDLFDRIIDDKVRIEEDGEVVVGLNGLKGFMLYTEIRGRNNYAFGSHKIRLQIEHSSDQWTFLGINSKLTPLQKSSFLAKSAYGWCNSNYIYSNGSYQHNKTNSPIEMKKNDTISLIFDCIDHKISMLNERTNIKHELDVNINKCPFPWQLHVILRQPDSRIRILSA
jgi:hypothetical protein